MRQTLIKEGVQDRLGNLIGNGVSSYSAQASMLENVERVCRALVGNSKYGRVMAGLNIQITSSPGSVVKVSSGYGITIGGKIIVFGSEYRLEGVPVTGTYQVYAKYVLADRGNSEGGKTMNFVNTGAQPIIRDQVGAKGEPGVDSIVLSYSIGDTISVDDNTLYLGTVSYSGGTAVVFRQNNDNETVDYTFSKDLLNVKLWGSGSSTALNTSFTTDTIMVLPPGRKRIRSLDILIKTAMTTSIHTQNSSDYKINIALNYFKSGNAVDGSPIFSTSLQEAINGRTVQHFEINQIVEDTVVGLFLSESITTADFGTNDGTCDICCIIEKLT